MFRKLATLLIAMTLIGGAQAQSAYIVQAAGVAALVDESGKTLIQDDGVDALIELQRDALYAAGREGNYALYDVEGNMLGDQRCDMFEVMGDAVLFRQDGRFGAMDANGKVLIAPEWAQLTCDDRGAFLALEGDLYDDLPDEMISVSANGDPLNTGSYTANGLCAFHDGRMAYMQSDGQYGFVDALGRQVIPPQWQYAGEFSDGVAIVSDGSGMGLIDAEGQIVVSTIYNWIQRGQSLIAAHTDDGWLDVYAPDGADLRFSVEGDVGEAEVCGEYIVVKGENGTRLYDKNGGIVLESSESTLFYPGLDGQVIAMDGEWGEACQRLVNPDGSDASAAYQRLLPLCRGRYAFLNFPAGNYADARCGLLSADGRELLPAKYLEILPAGEDRLVLVTEDKVIFADLDGTALREWPVTETAASSSEAGV